MSEQTFSACHPAKNWRLLVDTILKEHNTVKLKAGAVNQLLDQALQLDDPYSYELLEIRTKFNLLLEILEIHQYKEEVLLFPEFLQLWYRFVGMADAPSPFLMDYPIEGLREEHGTLFRMIIEIRQLRQYYLDTVHESENKNTIHQALFDFERSLILLIQKEETILFPQTLEMNAEVQIRS